MLWPIVAMAMTASNLVEKFGQDALEEELERDGVDSELQEAVAAERGQRGGHALRGSCRSHRR